MLPLPSFFAGYRGGHQMAMKMRTLFDLPAADLGCHPADAEKGAPAGTHDVSFYCDDIEKTVSELKSRGVEFTGPIADHGYGLVTFFKVPGGQKIQLYQPRYQKTTGKP